ncbi:MAG: hypothetical protein MN733_38780, partial [Nitrososphaera sp.]|nr:hypothetical protein [Nitrososphaera sp.]
EFFSVNLDRGCRKSRVVEVDVFVIQANDNNRMVDIVLPVRKFAGLNESKAGLALAQMVIQILKGTERLITDLYVQGFKMADMRGWGAKT